MDLYQKLQKHRDEGAYPMHMPGHKRNTDWMKMENPYGLDITEIDEFDDLHEPEGILQESMERAAEVYGADESWYLVGGSTVGILAGISAAVKPGSKVLVARNCHKSVYHALLIRRLKPVYLYPPAAETWGISGSVRPEDVESALAQTNTGDEAEAPIRLVILTSPTYEGVVSDTKRIAEICHRFQIPLLVDEAHGAHLGFSEYFPQSALQAGADLVVQSLHKTLPAFTQTGLLHRKGNRVSGRLVKHFLDMYQTSSPSYVLMAGIARCVELMGSESGTWMTDWEELLHGFYRPLRRLRLLRVLPEEPRGNREESHGFPACFYGRDPSKLVISTRGSGHTGRELMDILRKDYHFELEMASVDYCIAMTGAGDRWEAVARFAEALLDIDERWMREQTHGVVKGVGVKCWNSWQAVPRMYPWEADDVEGSELLLLDQKALGRIALDFLFAYPPGIPILAPGEEITAEVLAVAAQYEAAGISLRGYADEEKRIRVSKSN